MAVGTAPTTVRQETAKTPVAPRERRLRIVSDPERRGPTRPLHRTVAWCGALLVASMLMVTAADAYLTQGQVRLARLQQELTAELGQHRDLEARVASLTEPSKIVSEGQRNGLVAPSHVIDVPQVATTAPSQPSSKPPAGSQQPSSPPGGR